MITFYKGQVGKEEYSRSCEFDGAELPGFSDSTVDCYCRLYMRCGGSTRVATACLKVCLSPYVEVVLQLTALQSCVGSKDSLPSVRGVNSAIWLHLLCFLKHFIVFRAHVLIVNVTIAKQ